MRLNVFTRFFIIISPIAVSTKLLVFFYLECYFSIIHNYYVVVISITYVVESIFLLRPAPLAACLLEFLLVVLDDFYASGGVLPFFVRLILRFGVDGSWFDNWFMVIVCSFSDLCFDFGGLFFGGFGLALIVFFGAFHLRNI